MLHGTKPPAFVAIGIFLFFGATTAGLAATTLIWRGTVLDRVWTLNPTAYRQLSPLGSKVGILFLILSAALAVSGIGWFRHRLWGWRLAVAIIATQVLGDIINLVRGDWLRLNRSHHRWCIIDVPFVAPNQSSICGPLTELASPSQIDVTLSEKTHRNSHSCQTESHRLKRRRTSASSKVPASAQ